LFDFKEKKIIIMLRLEYNDSNLTLRNKSTNWGGGVWLYKGIPFTGTVCFYYPGTTQLSGESEHKDGIVDGRQADYWPNGQLKEEYFQKIDYHVGSFKRWDEQGNLLSHQENDEFGDWIKTIL
jgi:antitoxin component YwqK of YwqJK toxin-antitoxin module